MPDPNVMRRYIDDIESLSQAVRDQARETAESLRPTAARVVRTMVPALIEERENSAFGDDSESLTNYAYAVALGLCYASQEFQKGWTKDNQVDGRVHTAIALARPPGGYASSFFLQVGYWVGRSGEDGLRVLPGVWASEE